MINIINHHISYIVHKQTINGTSNSLPRIMLCSRHCFTWGFRQTQNNTSCYASTTLTLFRPCMFHIQWVFCSVNIHIFTRKHRFVNAVAPPVSELRNFFFLCRSFCSIDESWRSKTLHNVGNNWQCQVDRIIEHMVIIQAIRQLWVARNKIQLVFLRSNIHFPVSSRIIFTSQK